MSATVSADLPDTAQTMNHRREAFALTLATAFDRVVLFGMPLVLTRLLSVSDFGQYRTFWLVTLTVSGLAPLGMPRSLFYFLPRASPGDRRPFLDNTVLFLAGAGMVCAVLVLLGGRLAEVPAAGYLTPVFVVLWIVASLLDLLPSADQRNYWQAGVVMSLAVVRAALLIGAAATRDITTVIVALVGFVALKVGILAYYIGRYHGWRLPRLDPPRLGEQVRYAVPFGIDGALYSLRGNAEQWIVVILFLPAQYAVFSITGYMAPLVDIVRGSISNVLIPRMSEHLTRGNPRAMLALNIEGNLAAAAILLPPLAFLFANAREVLGILFPEAYAGAAPVLRIYVVAIARVLLDTTGVLMLLRQGRFIMGVSAFVLVLAAGTSYLGARLFGLPGAALGGLVAFYVEAAFSLRRIARLTGHTIGELQEWRGLASVLTAAVTAAAASHWALRATTSHAGAGAGMLVSAATMVGVYWVLLLLAGYGWMPHALLGRVRWRYGNR